MSEDLLGTLHDGRYCIMASWDDVPHISEAEKATLWASLPPHEREARSKGIPQLGSGAVWPVKESDIVEDDIEIPPHWPRAFAMDVGWNCTACMWGAWDRSSDCIHVYSVYKKGAAEPLIHSAAIKARGWWIPGVIDPASRGRSQNDGVQLAALYRELGLDLAYANNAVESGVFSCWQRLTTGRLKFFKSCVSFLEEFRLYRRDKNGHIVKQNDHLCDCLRYLVSSGMKRAVPVPTAEWGGDFLNQRWENGNGQGRNSVTGY